MKFICSVNKSVASHVDPKAGKILDGGNFSAFNTGWEASTLDAQEISEFVSLKAGLCAWHLKDGKREKNNTFPEQAGLIIIDIDNQADAKGPNGEKVQQQELTFSEALDLDICKKYLSLAYDSPSTSEEWPRFRLVFGLEKPITDPGFYQWFSKKVCSGIPGADFRALTVPQLFYGTKDATGILAVNKDKFIPESKINEAFIAYAQEPKLKEKSDIDPESILASCQLDTTGIDLVRLCSQQVRSVLNHEDVEDRSFTMTVVLKELIGWANWCSKHNVVLCDSPLTVAHTAFYCIYQYEHELDGKFGRILDSIHNPEDLLPAIAMASDTGEAACWKKISLQNYKVYDDLAPKEAKEKLAAAKPKPRNNVLTLEAFELENEFTDEPMTTPKTPTELIDLNSNQAKKQERQFKENDVAEALVKNYGHNFVYDSFLDKFYTYDNDEGIWYGQDEQHIKRRIDKALDSMVKAGLLPGYNATYVESVYKMLKSKLLKSKDGGRANIWSASKEFIPFANGVLHSETMEFERGNHKDLYFRSKLAYDYDPQAQCPEFLKWIKGALNTGNEILIQAFVRAILTGYTSGERFLHLVGPGGTGKSTMQQLLIAVAGFTQTHTSDLETIETNKFETFNLMGKRLLLLTDEAVFNKRMDTLKKLTSASDTLRAERKYGKEIISFKPELLVCIASNEHISSSDSTSGLERRRLTIVMDKVVAPSDRKQLIDVYEDRIEGAFVPEMSGIVTWALSMSKSKMKDVLANPVKNCPQINQTNIEALIYNNQFVAWLEECCLYAPNTKTIVGRGALKPSADEQERGLMVKNAHSELYASYSNFCKTCGFRACAKPKFAERVKETLNNILKIPHCKMAKKNGLPAIQGLRLKQYELSSDRAAYGDTRLPTPVEFAANQDFSLWETAFKKHDTAKPS